ncbi:MAG: hypothetical protein HY914_14320 [Desulfomonile tiedjei]|nr:hypothetical protein [Desulfomonile tiedjei]
MNHPTEPKTIQSRILAYAQEIDWTYMPHAESGTRREVAALSLILSWRAGV